MEVKLIEFVRSNELLYDKNCRSNKYTVQKDKKWGQIAKQLGTTIQAVKQRWKTLRDKYYREKKNMQSLEMTGYKGKLWKYYHYMKWLDDPDDPLIKSNNKIEECKDEFEIDYPEAAVSDNEQEFQVEYQKVAKETGTKNACCELSSIMSAHKESFTNMTPTRSFFYTLALQVEDANLPFERLSVLQQSLMSMVHEEINAYRNEIATEY